MSSTLNPAEPVNEGSSAVYRCTFTSDGAAINSASVSAITATLRDLGTGAVINSRTAQSVLGANGGTLAAAGAFALVLTAADNRAAADNSTRLQPRRLTLIVTFSTGTLTHEVVYHVQALADVPDLT